MSLFDNNLANKVIMPGPHGNCAFSSHLYARPLFDAIDGGNNMSDTEKNGLFEFYSRTLLGKGLFLLLPLLTARNGVRVIISENTPAASSRSDHPINVCNGLVLGEYYNDTDNIFLYIKNIRAASDDNKELSSSFLLLSVFSHELYHAFFHKQSYIPDIEEPLAEFGSLLYMNVLRKSRFVTYENVLALYEMILHKKDGLEHYSLGASLFLADT